MPRSGSELLQVLFDQNPEIYGSPTSPLLEYWFGARANRNTVEAQSQPQALMDDAFFGFCKGGMEGYYSNITEKPIVLDKSRGWIAYYKFLESVIEAKPKMVCMVRDLREIFTSMEKVYRKTRHLPVGPDNPSAMENITIEGRITHWERSQPIGLGLERLYDAKVQGYLQDVHIVRFEDLTTYPKATMQGIYEYLELPYFKHDFNNIIKSVEENDQAYGVYGDHKVKSKITSMPFTHNEIIGTALSDYLLEKYEWYFSDFYNM